jgi:hypothetical protein
LFGLGGGGQGLRKNLLQFYWDVAHRAWLVLRKVGKARILNWNGKANHHWGLSMHD